MNKNIIQENAKFYQRMILNNNLSYCLCLNNKRKINLSFSVHEFAHMTGLGQYYKEVNRGTNYKKINNIFKDAKNGEININDLDEKICQKHYVYEKTNNFQFLIEALDNTFDIYEYKKNNIFPNEEAKYLIHAKVQDKDILIFVDSEKYGQEYIRSFVAEPEQKKIEQIAIKLKALKIIYKEKNEKNLSPEILYKITPNFELKDFQEKLTPQELKQKQQKEKENNTYQEKTSKLKEKMRNDELSKLDKVKEELINMNHIVFNDMLNDKIIIDKKIEIPFNILDVVSIQNAIKTLKNIIDKEKEKSQKLINNELEMQDIPELV